MNTDVKYNAKDCIAAVEAKLKANAYSIEDHNEIAVAFGYLYALEATLFVLRKQNPLTAMIVDTILQHAIENQAARVLAYKAEKV